MTLIVGLGNPGKNYVNNRHNVGFRSVDFFARKQGVYLIQRKARSQLGVGEVEGNKVVLAKPRTFMNLSGEAVVALLRRYRLSSKNLIVIYDDLDIPLGKIRIRECGSSGGHKGIKSIIDRLGSQNFIRIRVGIAPCESANGTAFRQTDAVEYVLSDFTNREKVILRKVYPEVADAIRCILTEGILAAMNRHN